jgi:hypothetical protein
LDLFEKGLLAYADPVLAALGEAHSKFMPGTGWIFDIPHALRPPEEIDLLLCNNLVVTPLGHSAIRKAAG